MASLRLAALLLAVWITVSTTHAADGNVIAISGMKQLIELAQKHPFLVVEVSESSNAPSAPDTISTL
jgi:hypothetical protein